MFSIVKTIFSGVPLLALAALRALGQSGSYPYVLTTFAGTFPIGDGGSAVQALLNAPSAVALDGSGNTYILDSANYRIRKIDPSGNIGTAISLPVYCYDMKLAKDGSFYVTGPALVSKISPTGTVSIIAGTGVPGSSGDGIAATSAMLSASTGGIALDSSGNVYFVEGNRVREVTVADGIIHTVAGTQGAAGGFGGDNGRATSALLNSPGGIAVDSANNIYIADQSNSRVRKVASSNGNISTIAGNGQVGLPVNGAALSSPLGLPYGLTVDSSGNVYVTDIRFTVVFKIASSGSLTLMAGSQTFSYSDGPAISSYLNEPVGVTVDGSGNLFLAEKNGNRVREVTNGNLRTVAGMLHYAGDGGPATSALLNVPLDVALDGQGDVFIADYSNYRIRKVTPDGNISTFAGSGIPAYPPEAAPAISAGLPPVYAMAADANGNLYLAAGLKVLKITTAGVVSTLAGAGSPGDTGDGGAAAKATFLLVTGVAVDASANVYVADAVANRVRKVSAADGTIAPFAGTGKPGSSGDGGLATSALLNLSGNAPLAVDHTGNVYIGDGGNKVVRVVAPNGIIGTSVGNGTLGMPTDGDQAASSPFSAAAGIAVDSSGTLYITSQIYYNIYNVDSTGIIHVVGGAGADAVTDGVLANSTSGFNAKGIKVDASGDLYVADEGNQYVGYPGNAIRKLILNSPSGLAIASGNNQTAPAGSALPQALTVTVNGRGGVGAPGVTVDFAVTSGSATLSAASSQSDSSGTAGVGVTLGSDAGDSVITATIDSSSLPGVQFTVTATAN
jgi:sugar lactone lactonase YvrE